MNQYLMLEETILTDFLRALGPWAKHLIIGGGFAPIIYRNYLSDLGIGLPPVGTRDIDTLIPRNLPKVSAKSISQHLKEAGFQHRFKNLEEPPVEAYSKIIEGSEFEIEFLTPPSVRGTPFMNASIAGVIAQPLHYLIMSLEEIRLFSLPSGQEGHVVSPGAWIFHKGLTFLKRKDSMKQLKDLYGIWYVASQLGSFSYQSLNELRELHYKHQKWFQTFKKNFSNWLENASPKDWMNLELQDPNGNLSRSHFQDFVHSNWI